MQRDVVHRPTRALNDAPVLFTPNTSDETSSSTSLRVRIGWWLLLSSLLLSLIIAQPVAAQSSNPVCSDASGTLPNMIEGFIQLTTALGLMGLLVVWQADELMEMFTLSPEQKQKLKNHKRSAIKSASVLVLLGPLFTVAGSVMQLPVAQCVDLAPF